MPYYKRIEEDEWLRLQRRNERNNSSTASSSNGSMKQLTAFKSMTRVEQEWISAWYDQFVQHEQLHLWKRFEALSIGQKRAVVLDIAHANHNPEDGHPDWKEWDDRLMMMAEVPLQDEDSLQEKRNDEVLPLTSFYMMKQSELLSPYREILWWLCYKGNHQGQQALLQSIDQLGIDAKKLLILRLNGKQKCNSLHFSQQLTMIQHEQTVVDWDRISHELQSLKQLASDEIHAELLQLEPQSQSQMAPPNVNSHVTIDEEEQDVLEARSDYGFEHTDDELDDQLQPLLSIGDQRNAILHYLDSEHELAALLGNLAFVKQPKPMKKVDFVDLCLKIPYSWPSKKRDKAREKKLKSLNFSSLQQFFDYILKVIISNLYQEAVLKKKSSYIELLRALSLIKDGSLPSEEAMTKQLLARFE